MKQITLKNMLIVFLFIFSSCEKIKTPVVELPCSKGISSHPNREKYEKLIKKILETGAPGVSMTVITPDGIWSGCGGKADLKDNVTLSPCHTLRIGSVSKLFCAAAILKLQDEGVLNIDEYANKYIPRSITDKVPNGNEVTIKQLLKHTAGIPEYSTFQNVAEIKNLSNVKLSAEENLKTIYGKKVDFAPGAGMSYSNSNFLMLALVIKYATGKNANDIVNEKIIQPLGLENIFMSTDIPTSLSRAYFDQHDNGRMIDNTEIDNNAVGGQDMLDGGVIANSYDLAVFFKQLVNGNVISPASLAQMETCTDITQELPPELNHLKQYGLGLMKLETDHGRAIGHYGSVYCFNGLVYHFPAQNITVALIRNGDSHKIKSFFESKELFNYLF
jgi:D-alanyl-D-alanine carboxypeptidase